MQLKDLPGTNAEYTAEQRKDLRSKLYTRHKAIQTEQDKYIADHNESVEALWDGLVNAIINDNEQAVEIIDRRIRNAEAARDQGLAIFAARFSELEAVMRELNFIS